ncbi:MAG: transposase [Clostridiales bacterium]|jgi:IS4 transposase|nr:transposase [Clostridiales bacterium]
MKTSGTPSELLFIFDRGYPSAGLIEVILHHKAKFLMRCKTKFNTELDNIHGEGKITLTSGVVVRCVSLTLDSNETEYLLTNLSRKDYPITALKLLYVERWRVEESNNILKSYLNLENISGRLPIAVYQDT